MKYWVSWFSGNYADEGCTKPPFQYWLTGDVLRDDGERTNGTYCAALYADNEEQIWETVEQYFPDYAFRFIQTVKDDWEPRSDRFPKDQQPDISTKD